MANTTIGAQGLLHVIHKKRAEVVALLLTHGVVVKQDASDMDIAMAVTNLSKTSKSFYNAFMKLLMTKDVVTSVYSNMDGFANAGGSLYTPTNFTIGNTSSSTDTFCDKAENKALALCGGKGISTDTTTSTSGGSSKWLTEGLNLLQSGFNGYLQLDENKTKRALADASQNVKSGDVELAKLGLLPANKTNTSNTALYVVLGILGVSVIGLVVYLATKKKA
jgi:hypothetical protein